MYKWEAGALRLLGCKGDVSGTANVAPGQVHQMCMAAIADFGRRARALHLQLLPLHRQLFCKPSPAPTKWALARMGRCGTTLRLPLTDLTAAGQATVRDALHASGVL